MTSTRILVGDALERLRELQTSSVHAVVTSPPYYGLRDYGAAGQIGLEETLEAYVEALEMVFAETARVLRLDGTLWLNLGDTYAGSWGAQGRGPAGDAARSSFARHVAKGTRGTAQLATGLPAKSLLGVPWRVAFALQASGWILRASIVWAKPATMPESARDRPTRSHELLFLLTRRPRYYYDAEAIAEPVAAATARDRVDGARFRPDRGFPGSPSSGNGRLGAGATRNARDVWRIASSPFPGAHFATFPPELAARCIRAATSAHGVCRECGGPWERQTERRFLATGPGRAHVAGGDRTAGGGDGWEGTPRGHVATSTTGWASTCAHDAAGVSPATVLDPFGGAGTTGLVANRLGRDAILIEIAGHYAELAEKRILSDAPLFRTVTRETEEAVA